MPEPPKPNRDRFVGNLPSANENDRIKKARQALENTTAVHREASARLVKARQALADAEKQAVKSGKWDSKQLQAAQADVTNLESKLRVIVEVQAEALEELKLARGQVWDAELGRLKREYGQALQAATTAVARALQAIESLQQVELEAHRIIGDEFPQLGRSPLLLKLRWWLERAINSTKNYGGEETAS